MSNKEEVDIKTKRELITICAQLLSVDWGELDENDIICKNMPVGLSNKTYYCSIANCKYPEKYGNVTQKEVIVHMFGSGVFGEKNPMKFNGEAAEAVMIYMLAKRGLYPKLLGVFDGGRIQEYIPSRMATVDDLKSFELSRSVIRKLALFHSTNFPISKSPNLLEKMEAAMATVGEMNLDKLKDKYNPLEQVMIQNILNFNLKAEIGWIASIIPKINHRVICSHNDMNSNNILLKNEYTSEDDRVVIIDLEMCRYFFRGYDLAYFSRMRKSRLSRDDNGKVSLTEEDTDETRNDELLNEYLKTFSTITNQFDAKYDTLEHLKMEIELFDLLYDCMIIGYAIVVMKHASVSVEYVHQLATKYNAKKSIVVNRYGDIFATGD